MTIHDPLPRDIALIKIKKDDLHYLQRSARRHNEREEETLHRVIENHRYPGRTTE